MNNIGNTIKKYRNELGLTQAELARKVGIARSSISHYETEFKKPSITNADKLAKALNISLEQLIRGNKNE